MIRVIPFSQSANEAIPQIPVPLFSKTIIGCVRPVWRNRSVAKSIARVRILLGSMVGVIPDPNMPVKMALVADSAPPVHAPPPPAAEPLLGALLSQRTVATEETKE